MPTLAGQQIALPYRRLSPEDLKDPHLVLFNQMITEIYQSLNILAGNHGDTQLNAGVQATKVISGKAAWSSGQGNPNSNVAGNVGDLYTDTQGSAGKTLYVKESGSGTKTGWVAK